MTQDRIGSVMVVGGGIAGMPDRIGSGQSGYYVYLVERSSSIGGVMAQLDKTSHQRLFHVESSRPNWSRSAGISTLSF